MAAGRLPGDRLVQRFGTVAVFRVAALVVGIGLAAGLAGQSVAGALAGFAFLGLSVTMPITISTADATGNGSTAHAVGGIGDGVRGLVRGPAVIGLLATATNLTVALVLPAALVVALVPFAGQMARSRSTQ